MAAGDPVHSEPPDIEHADVVVDMKKCDLVVVLPQDEEEGVHELDQLGEVVPPQDVYDLPEGAEKQIKVFPFSQIHIQTLCLPRGLKGSRRTVN